MESSIKQLTADEFLSFQSGDEHIFKYVYGVYYDLIIQKVYRLCREIEVAEEIVQESFVQLFLHKEKLRDAAGIYPYLYIISKRQAISYFRRKISRERFREDLRHQWEEQSDESQQSMEGKDITRVIYDIIDQLPTQQRLVYKMNKFDEKSYHEIADAVGLSKNTVRNHIANASKIVRFKLDNLFFLLFFIKDIF
ncbi:sigma-70 family RNA polymerase sigma factor [Sphingobacterium sp. SGG-5]|uniref:RNA polymerase sigma factor n=1 Tax=Sphingobacterium sp. SGG-5 TaxID=2710881 RepID=UPI0013EA9AC8|nr:sigma-70 family RNA polymerase sigma factor [Sphingobacterium sp. SGG-5]NGM62079.1 sigma-70 family RNA polymerase sigma factor [Sphingobacterium sp. SGG-5]